MYRNPRSKGIKIKNILQVCLLLAVCFWLIFQVKRSRDKNKEFDATHHHDDKLTTRIQRSDEIVKLGRKDLPSKLDQTVKEVEKHEHEEEEEEVEEVEEVGEDNKHEEEEIDEEKDDEIDENDQQQKSDMEIERDEVDVIDEDKESEEREEESQNDNTDDIDKEHTHELREEHYKADDASSAVTHDGSRLLGTENEIKNGTLDKSNENVGQENESGPLDSSVNPASSIENGPPSNTTIIEQVSNSTNETKVETDERESENLETSNEIEGTEETLDPDEVQHLEEKEVRTDLDTLPEIEIEVGNSEDTAEE